MKYRYFKKSDRYNYYFTSLRKPENIYRAIKETLHGETKTRKETKKALNNFRKLLATETRYWVIVQHIKSIQVHHERLLYLGEVLIWLRQEYCKFIEKHPEFKENKG